MTCCTLELTTAGGMINEDSFHLKRCGGGVGGGVAQPRRNRTMERSGQCHNGRAKNALFSLGFDFALRD